MKGGDNMNKNIKLLLCLVGVLALLQVSLTKGHTEESAAPEAVAAVANDAADAVAAVANGAEDAAADAAENAAIELSGTITSIEPETSTIVVEYAAEGDAATSSTSSFKVTEDTAIIKAEAPITLADLQIGAQVNLQFKLDAEGTK